MEPITPEQLTNLCQEALAEVVEEVIEQPATFHLLEYKLSNGCREGVLDNVKMALYCPQSSGTLRQQLLMMHSIAWNCMVLHGIAWYCMVL